MKWKTLATVRLVPRVRARGTAQAGARIQLGPENVLDCSACRPHLPRRLTYVHDTLESPKDACGHIHALYYNSMVAIDLTRGAPPWHQPRRFAVKLTPLGEKMFHWRWTTRALTETT